MCVTNLWPANLSHVFWPLCFILTYFICSCCRWACQMYHVLFSDWVDMSLICSGGSSFATFSPFSLTGILVFPKTLCRLMRMSYIPHLSHFLFFVLPEILANCFSIDLTMLRCSAASIQTLHRGHGCVVASCCDSSCLICQDCSCLSGSCGQC